LPARDPELTIFLESLHEAVGERARADSDACRLMRTIAQALRTVQPAASPEPVRWSVCAYLDEAVRNTAATAGETDPDRSIACGPAYAAHARSLLALSSRLAWWRRPGPGLPGLPFADHHANATLVGPGGLEERDDLWVGASLMAPGLRYPEHHHPPEEVYLVLSDGHWQQGSGAWHEPGAGGVVHNPPDVLHAMRSGSRPLLATWCLWLGR